MKTHLRQYFPIRDPISDLRLSSMPNNTFALSVFIDGRPGGFLVFPVDSLASVLGVFAGHHAIAQDDLFEGFVNFTRDYFKDHVISSDGELIHVGDLP